MKSKLKKFLATTKLIYLYRAIKYVLMYLNPGTFFSNVGYKLRGAHDGFPNPPLYLIYLTINQPSLFEYYRGGYITARAIKQILAKNKIEPEKFNNILELGSGAGRVLREFTEYKNSNLFGCDYNNKLVNWCRKKLYFADFYKNELNPPVKYQDRHFDFVYLISVFTHLPEATQKLWLKEFYRIIDDNKYLLITLHGENVVQKMSDTDKKEFHEKGYFEISVDKAGTNHFGTFHTKEHFNKLISGMFEIVDITYGGTPNHPYQDIYLLRKI